MKLSEILWKLAKLTRWILLLIDPRLKEEPSTVYENYFIDDDGILVYYKSVDIKA